MVVVEVYEVPGAADVHLVEVSTDVAPPELDIGAFTQEQPGEPRENWQAPWLERYLDPDGARVLTEAFDPPPEGLTSTRVVFFMHCLDLDRPLLTPEGPVDLPAPTELPDRLAAVEYEPVD